MKKPVPRMEGNNGEVIDGVIEVGSEEDDLSGRVRLEVS